MIRCDIKQIDSTVIRLYNMAVIRPISMGRQSRKYIPRTRTKRPVGLQTDADQSPTKPHPLPKKMGDRWFLPNPLGARLHQKSGLGIIVDNGITLLPLEVLFCHWNRHVPIEEDWVSEIILEDPDFIAKSVVFDVSRSGGEIVIPIANSTNHGYSKQSFAVKWSRNKSHFKDEPISQIRWFWASSDVDWEDLKSWVNEVITAKCIPEIFVVDDEMDITMYRLGYEELSGNQKTWSDLSDQEIMLINSSIDNLNPTKSGCYITDTNNWPLTSIGIEHLSGINLRNEEIEWLKSKLYDNINNNDLFSFLVDSGCILRPGFKYGCKWRVYDDDVSKSHAPWLLQPFSEAPESWEKICLAVRLAEGVHKKWVCGFHQNSEWKFLNIKRWLPGRV